MSIGLATKGMISRAGGGDTNVIGGGIGVFSLEIPSIKTDLSLSLETPEVLSLQFELRDKMNVSTVLLNTLKISKRQFTLNIKKD